MWHFISKRCIAVLCIFIASACGARLSHAQQLQQATPDSAIADSVSKLIPLLRLPSLTPLSGEPEPSAFYYLRTPAERLRTIFDSTGTYESQRFINGVAVGIASERSFESYASYRLGEQLQQQWQTISQDYRSQIEGRDGMLDFRFDVPAGEESAFATIFGRNEVNLSVNGTANVNVGASVQRSENPQIPEDQRTQINPLFNQNLKLNVQGTIGDKLSINTDWDTEAAFDFQNRVNIVYDGYDNEILQRLELGNVSMQTGNALIRGGGALFGVKSVAQLGALELTSVVSQQNGQANTQTITGGAEEQQIALRPGSYENDTHFFLDFFTRQQYEQNTADPQQLGQALQLSEVNVWVLRESSQSIQGERQAIALVDLGVVQNPDSSYQAPNDAQDGFPDALLDQFRNPSIGVSAADFNVPAPEFVEGYFVPLQQGSDYEINRPLGYITLKRNLGARQALAVSFKYINQQTAQTVSVGEVSQGGGNRLYLKMLRPQTVTTGNAAWDLMMKNIYNLGVSNLTEGGLDVAIQYTEQNVAVNSLPGRTTPLLQDLGLDRVNQQGAAVSDNTIDFSTGTLDAINGRIIFPYLQPFGDRIRNLLGTTGLSPPEIENLVFDDLYDLRKVNANQDARNNYYRIDGRSQGSVSANYSLGFSPVEGSVRVFANGQELQEGTEYTVDYSIGNVSILDDRYLRRGQEIRIEYENNQFTQIQQKTFRGVRAQYDVNNNISLGATYFGLNEQPLQDKIRIGNEPVSNSVLGFDANAGFEVPWLTRAVNTLPFMQQTQAPSRLQFSGEFARLQPGVAQTNAVEEAIGDNRLFDDEEQGLSFIDDFEGIDIGLSFIRPSRWNLAAAPAAIPGYEPDEIYFNDNTLQPPATTLPGKLARSDLRSSFSWYSIPRNINRILNGAERTPETQEVQVTDVFPNRDVLSEDNVLTTLDVRYDPTQRGPYNYNTDLRNLLENTPERSWGGMVTTLPSGQEDLTQNNIAFLEFWVQPVLPAGRAPTAQDMQNYEGKIYIDVGVVSEDVVPNFKTNTEDGLARRPDDLEPDNLTVQPRSYIPNPPPAPQGQFANDTRALEDVGLDGAPNSGGINNQNEQVLFDDFLTAMEAAYGTGSAEFQAIQSDPSNDDYVYYAQNLIGNVPLQERFYRLYGYTDGNTPANNSGNTRAITNRPDTEGLITPSIVQQNNAYYQYEVDFNPATIENEQSEAAESYIIDRIRGQRQQDRWYQVRIPLTDFARRVGDIQNFQNVSYIRFWMSGYERPFTLRFATFELVGNQWRPADNVNEDQPFPSALDVSSINIEENSRRQPIPYRQPEGAIRATNRSQQRRVIANEQSIVLNADDLGPGQLNMIKRVYPGGLNMVNYANARMFVHSEGYEDREDLELVMRFGTDLVNNYYEYRQPITPSDPNFPFSGEPLGSLSAATRNREAREVWRYDENSMNILLSAFNQLKQLRDQQGVAPDERFEGAPVAFDTAPGARLAIKGNPSLNRINEIGMGLRNPFDPQNPTAGGVPSVDAEVWLNELRVSGFDNRNGWAANARAELQVADVATVSLTMRQQTDGFGALSSRLGQRSMADEFAYDINTAINMHAFLPDRYGWNIPVAVSAGQVTSTPRFLPSQGDVTFSEFEQAVNSRTDLSASQQQSLIEQTRFESKTAAQSRSLSIANATKTGSESALARYTLDKTTLNWVYNTTDRRSPQFVTQDQWNFDGSLRYNINFETPSVFRPFNFLGDSPLLHPLAGLQLGYTPASITGSIGMRRSYNQQRRRLLTADDSDPSPVGQSFPLQQTHLFDYNTGFGFTYNLTPAINTGFENRSVFDLSTAGIRPDGRPGTADSLRFEVIPTTQVITNVLTDTLSARRSDYREAYTAGWDPALEDITPVSWVDYSANYTGGYQWRNSPAGSGLGATVNNNLSLNQTLRFDMNDLLNRSSWYRQLQSPEENSAPSEVAAFGQNVLARLLSLRQINASFSVATSALQTGYAGESPFFSQFNTSGDRFSPPFGYRTGIFNEINRDRLITNPDPTSAIQIPSNRNLSDNLTLGARFEPFKNIAVDLSWSALWDKTYSRSITLSPTQQATTVFNQSGNVTSSVWAFGGGYEDFFRDQLQIARNDIQPGSAVLSDAGGNADGRSVLGRQSLQESFREAYTRNGGVIGERSFMPFPLPAWQVRWAGLEEVIPYAGDFMARASLRHSYRGSYRLGYLFNADESLLPPVTLGDFTVQNRRPEFEPTTINIEKAFAPLIGLDITWLSDLRTNLQFNYSNLTSLALSNATVTERKSRGLRLSVNYTINNFNIPLFPRFRNAVDVTINSSYILDTQTQYVLSSDLDNALQQPQNDPDPDFSNSFRGGQARVNVASIVGYEFSQTLKANFEYVYNRLIPRSTGVFPRTDHDILFNLIVSIRSN